MKKKKVLWSSKQSCLNNIYIYIYIIGKIREKTERVLDTTITISFETSMAKGILATIINENNHFPYVCKPLKFH